MKPIYKPGLEDIFLGTNVSSEQVKTGRGLIPETGLNFSLCSKS